MEQGCLDAAVLQRIDWWLFLPVQLHVYISSVVVALKLLVTDHLSIMDHIAPPSAWGMGDVIVKAVAIVNAGVPLEDTFVEPDAELRNKATDCGLGPVPHLIRGGGQVPHTEHVHEPTS